MAWLFGLLSAFLWVLVVLLVLVLLVPLEYRAEGSRAERARGCLQVSWLFGVLAVTATWRDGRPGAWLCVLGREFPLPLDDEKKKRRKKEKKEKKKKKKKEENWRTWVQGADPSALWERALFREVRLFARRVLLILAPWECFLQARVGFEDPSQTGVLCAVYYPAVRFFQKRGVFLEPCFWGACLQGSFRIRGRIVLAMLVGAVLRFVLSGPVRRVWRSRKGNQRKQQSGRTE